MSDVYPDQHDDGGDVQQRSADDPVPESSPTNLGERSQEELAEKSMDADKPQAGSPVLTTQSDQVLLHGCAGEISLPPYNIFSSRTCARMFIPWIHPLQELLQGDGRRGY